MKPAKPYMPFEPAENARLRTLASRTSLTVAIVLVVLKLGAWIATGSVALLSSAIDALVDAAASLATWFGVRYAQQPPDADHRFGHGKGEAVAAFTQAVFLGGAALILALQSLQRLASPVAITDAPEGMLVIVFSLFAAIGLVFLQTYVVRRTASTAIAADRAHYTTDIATNLAVLLALWLAHRFGWQRADPICALVISGYMFWSAWHITREALKPLLDHELPETEREKIVEIVMACEGVKGIHDLRTRHAGDRIFVEYHLEVDGHLSVDRGHAIGDLSESAVAGLLPGLVEVTAHLEPFGIDDERLDDRVAQARLL